MVVATIPDLSCVLELATFGSGVTYKGNSAKNGDNIQIRASSNTQDKSGIVATTTKGYVRSVEVATITAERDLDVYGSNDAYSGPADLYGDAKALLSEHSILRLRA